MTHVIRIGCVAAILIFAGIASPVDPVTAQSPGAQTAAVSTDDSVESLARDVVRAQDLRTVKDLQYLYIQLAEFGMWDEMGQMFTDNAEARFGDDVSRGRAQIARYLLENYGAGKVGLPVGGVHVELFQAPVVTLAVDGKSAMGRWQKLVLRGRFGGDAKWEGGMEVNTYVKEPTGWKIARLQYYRQFAGPYETGWFSTTPDSPIVPYHYTPTLAGRPVPDQAGDADRTPTSLTLNDIERRVSLMNDQDKVRNLQNIYGYYVDRKMWDDVTDLFTSDGVLEIAGIGVYEAAKGIRRALERDGPSGLKSGQVNDHLQFHTVITMDPGGQEATARGLDFGMLTPKLGEAYWSESVFINRFVKQDGIWRISEMRIFPKMKADYYQGWGKSAIDDPVPGGASAPDKPSPASESLKGGGAIPAFTAPNISTGRAISYPSGTRIVGAGRRAGSPPAEQPVMSNAVIPLRVAEARRKLNVSKGYDAVENISSTFGYYLDDFLWDEFVENMARDGTRPQGRGFYVGRDHIYRAMMQSHLAPWSPTNPRDGIRLHTRIQPVIDITPDATSAKIRTRMFLYFANSQQPGAWNSGMYPNDTAVLEDGAWKMKVGGVIDETYFSSQGYKQGWAKPNPAGRGRSAGPAPDADNTAAGPGRQGGRGVSRNGNPIDFGPDIPWSLFDGFRRKGFREANWPDIKPMWFHYRNPVSGRTPPNYCPDILTCHQF
jgi:hypothetical protein